MNQEEIREIVISKLCPFMSRFEQDNRGNKISLEFIQGLGMILENHIVDIIMEIEKQKGPADKSPDYITKN